MKNYSCPFEILVTMVSGKWKLIILWHLNKDGVKRFSEIQKIAHEASSKVLSHQLRQLEQDGLVMRKVYPEVPPRVEYYITDLGKSLWPVLLSMQKWSIEFLKMQDIKIDEYIIEEYESLKSKHCL